MEIIRLAKKEEKSLAALYRTVTKSLQAQGIRQWDWVYPNRFVVRGDINRGTVYGILDRGRVIGAVVVDDRQSRSYSSLLWTDTAGSPACIHRLAVHPSYQGQGIGKKLLQFAERLAQEEGRTSIRLDVYTGNPGAVCMYRKAGYADVGEIRYPMRESPYLVLERLL
jgi:ribosomal protein S18 acetylase RimI-like enzyme